MSQHRASDNTTIQLATDDQVYAIYKGAFFPFRNGEDHSQTHKDLSVRTVRALRDLIGYENWVIPDGESDFKSTAATIPLSTWKKIGSGEVEPTSICLVTHVGTEPDHRQQAHAKGLLCSLPYIKGDDSVLPAPSSDLPPVTSEGIKSRCIGSQLMTHLPDSFYAGMAIGDTDDSRPGWQMHDRYNKELRLTSTYRRPSPRSGWRWGIDGQVIKKHDLTKLARGWSEKARKTMHDTQVPEGEALVCMDPGNLPELVEAKMCLDKLYMTDKSIRPVIDSCGIYLLSKVDEDTSKDDVDISTKPCVLINRYKSRLILSLMDNVTPNHLPEIIRGVEEYSLELPLPMSNPWSIVIWGKTDDAISNKWRELGGEEIDKITMETDENGHQRYAFADWSATGNVTIASAEAWSHSFY